MKWLLYDERGNIQDIGFGMIILFTFAMVVLFTGVVFEEFNAEFQNSSAITAQGKSHVRVNEERYVGLFDGLAAFTMIGVLIGILALAFVIRSQPAFAVVGLFIVSLFILVAAILSNVWFDLTDHSSTESKAEELEITDHIVNNLPIVLSIMALLVAVIFYGKQAAGGLR